MRCEGGEEPERKPSSLTTESRKDGESELLTRTIGARGQNSILCVPNITKKKSETPKRETKTHGKEDIFCLVREDRGAFLTHKVRQNSLEMGKKTR